LSRIGSDSREHDDGGRGRNGDGALVDPEIASITGHSMKTVQEILDVHYLGGRVELAESAIKKLSEVSGRNRNEFGMWIESR
jgi:hypothetical protein